MSHWNIYKKQKGVYNPVNLDPYAKNLWKGIPSEELSRSYSKKTNLNQKYKLTTVKPFKVTRGPKISYFGGYGQTL